MENKRSIEVTVAGHTLPIRTAASAADVQAAADLVEQKLEEIVSNKAMMTNQVLLLVALILADDLIKTKKSTVQFQENVRSKSEALLTQLDEQFGIDS